MSRTVSFANPACERPVASGASWAAAHVPTHTGAPTAFLAAGAAVGATAAEAPAARAPMIANAATLPAISLPSLLLRASVLLV